jgi:hypothetical protein
VTQVLEDLITRQFREPSIEEDGVIRSAARQRQGGLAIECAIDLKSIEFEQSFRRLRDSCIILDEKDMQP